MDKEHSHSHTYKHTHTYSIYLGNKQENIFKNDKTTKMSVNRWFWNLTTAKMNDKIGSNENEKLLAFRDKLCFPIQSDSFSVIILYSILLYTYE